MNPLFPLIPIEQYAFTKTFNLYILPYYLHPWKKMSHNHKSTIKSYLILLLKELILFTKLLWYLQRSL